MSRSVLKSRAALLVGALLVSLACFFLFAVLLSAILLKDPTLEKYEVLLSYLLLIVSPFLGGILCRVITKDALVLPLLVGCCSLLIVFGAALLCGASPNSLGSLFFKIAIFLVSFLCGSLFLGALKTGKRPSPGRRRGATKRAKH